MRVTIFLLCLASVAAFIPAVQKQAPKTVLHLERRDVLITGIMGLLGAPAIATAKGSTFFFDDETVQEQSQQATNGLVDLNNAFVVSMHFTICHVFGAIQMKPQSRRLQS
jgi:hypothetical protein